MYFVCGSFALEPGEARPTLWDKRLTHRGSQLEAYVTTLGIEIDVVKDGEANIQFRVDQIKAGLTQQFRDTGFRLANGQPSEWWLDNATSTTGVLLAQAPGAVPTDPADYATHLRLAATYYAAYEPAELFAVSGLDGILQYQESVSIRGTGGPRRVTVAVSKGAPHRYDLTERTVVQVVQSGSLVQNRPGVFPNPPVLPGYEVEEARDISPVVRRSNRAGSDEYGIGWTYVFELPDWQVVNPLPR